MQRPIHLSHAFLEEVLDSQAIAIDATMGNGNDTLFLAQRAKTVYAFDIQEQALTKTQKRLTEAGLTNAHLHLMSHADLDRVVSQPVRAAIFNLGYLPSADKTIITHAQSTLTAINKILALLEIGGRVSIMIYYGHDGGSEEKDAVLKWVSQLDQCLFTVMQYKPLNQINTPPFLVMIEKIGDFIGDETILTTS